MTPIIRLNKATQVCSFCAAPMRNTKDDKTTILHEKDCPSTKPREDPESIREGRENDGHIC